MRRAQTLVAATILGIGMATAGISPAAADLDADQFRLRAATMTERFEDVGRKGESLGDSFISTEKLFHGGERVGTSAVTCQVTRFSQRMNSIRLLCHATLSLRGKGDLIIHGKVVFRRGSNARPVLAVTGGTGDYAGASGTMTLDEERRSSHYIIQLLP